MTKSLCFSQLGKDGDDPPGSGEFGLQPTPLAGVPHNLHTRMQIFQSSGVSFYIQFEDEMTISLALETTKNAAG
jgi:hypothetical protein